MREFFVRSKVKDKQKSKNDKKADKVKLNRKTKMRNGWKSLRC